MPSTGMAVPGWTMDHFRRAAGAAATQGGIAVLQFHGVPDEAHPWAHTEPEMFRRYMDFLVEEGCRGIAVGDLELFIDREAPRSDPLRSSQHREPRAPSPEPPAEVQATRDDLDYWMENMLVQHIYSRADTAQTAGVAEGEVIRHENRLRRTPRPQGVRVLPYPGGRQPRTGFLDGAWDPLRGDQG